MPVNTVSRKPVTKTHSRLLQITALITLLLVTLGGVVCVTDSSQGCPDWPWCYGKLYPPLQQDSIIEYTHRVTAMLASLLIVISAVVSFSKTPRLRWVTIPAALSILFLIAVSFFGAMVVLSGLSRGWAAVDLGSALTTLALMIIAAFAAKSYNKYPEEQVRFSLKQPLAGLVLITAITAFVLLVSGVLAAESGSIERCLGLPLFSQEMLSAGALGGMQIFRRVLTGILVLLIAATAVQAWRKRRSDAGILRSTVLLVIALLAELIIGVLMLNFGFSLALEVLYVSMATVIWAVLVLMLMQTTLQIKTR
jgi:heme A synthase